MQRLINRSILVNWKLLVKTLQEVGNSETAEERNIGLADLILCEELQRLAQVFDLRPIRPKAEDDQDTRFSPEIIWRRKKAVVFLTLGRYM